jgi:hypothetical protein
MAMDSDVRATAHAPRGLRRWSSAALVWALAMSTLSVLTFGLAVFLAPIGVALSTVAWQRSAHDGVFWVGATLNALSLLGLIVIVVGLLTGDVGIGLD